MTMRTRVLARVDRHSSWPALPSSTGLTAAEPGRRRRQLADDRPVRADTDSRWRHRGRSPDSTIRRS